MKKYSALLLAVLCFLSASAHAEVAIGAVADVAPVVIVQYLQAERISELPEPEGWAMTLLGIGFVVYQVRRRKKAQAQWDLK